jgi:hypothetical protein
VNYPNEEVNKRSLEKIEQNLFKNLVLTPKKMKKKKNFVENNKGDIRYLKKKRIIYREKRIRTHNRINILLLEVEVDKSREEAMMDVPQTLSFHKVKHVYSQEIERRLKMLTKSKSHKKVLKSTNKLSTLNIHIPSNLQ